ncbi:MAG: amidohydrolase [Candidimonas sp.]|nr:MAG: amidohydrolase [Candidimonas sp.]
MNTVEIDQTLNEWHEEMKALRHDLHSHPELAFQELRTSSLIKNKLTQWNIEVVSAIAITGVVGIIRGQQPGSRAIGLRADMDALPLKEENTFAHASVHENKMHGCGHDGHVLMLLAAARYLATHNDFCGIVYLIFQPAEESGGGARKMMAEGLFELFPMDAVFGMHNWPGLALGHFGIKPGPIMASTNYFHITVKGKGAHAAMPQLSVDPVVAIAQLALALQTVVSRNLNPLSAAVLSITQMNVGNAHNVIPAAGTLVGSVRTLTLDVLDLIEKRVKELSLTISSAFGCEAQVNFVRNDPPTINHADETEFCLGVLKSTFGEDEIHTEIEPSMAAEDFSWMLLEKPGCYIWIGNGALAQPGASHGVVSCALHNSHYDFNDRLIDIGAKYWIQLALAKLPNQ